MTGARRALAWDLRERSSRPTLLSTPGFQRSQAMGPTRLESRLRMLRAPEQNSGTFSGSARRWPQRACAEGDGDAEGDGGAVTGAGLRAGAAVAPGEVAESF
jgi:hypothetical protein